MEAHLRMGLTPDKKMEQRINARSKIGLISIGFILGLGLSILLGMLLLARRSQVLIQLTSPTPAATTTPTSSAIPEMPTPTLTPTAMDPSESILLQAENEAELGNLEQARQLLLTLTELELTEEQYARLYYDLGSLEYMQGNSRLACGYFENQFAHERTPEVLYVMASICAESGLYVKAARYYQDLVNWEGSEADLYREDAQYALNQIRYMLGTPEPTELSH